MILTDKEGKKIEINETHFYVSRDADPGLPFCFTSVKAAADRIPDGTPDAPSVIRIEPDVYWTESSPTSCGLVIRKNWLTLEGLGENPEDTVIADARGHMVNAYPADRTASSPAQTVIVNGDGFRLLNMTIGNYLNLDLEYPKDPSKSRKAVSDVITQAYALASQGKYDFWTFEHCRIVSMLDTLSFCHRRAYFHDSYIEGTKDFLGGGDRAVYKDCVLRVHDTCPMYMAGETATLYKNCRFLVSLEDFDTMYLTKFGRELILDCCSFEGNVRHLEWELETKPEGRCYFRNLTLNGKPAVFSPETPDNGVEITEQMEEAFSVYNLLAGEDGWNPSGSGKREAFPICIRVKAPASVTAGEEVRVEAETDPKVPLSELHAETEGAVEAYLRNDQLFLKGTSQGELPEKACLTVSFRGVRGCAYLLSRPSMQKQPDFRKLPEISVKDQILSVSYELEHPEYGDCSRITWKRRSDGRILAVTQGKPCRTYRLQKSDIGEVITAEVIPHNERSAEKVIPMFTEDLGKTRTGFLIFDDQGSAAAADSPVITREMITDPSVFWESFENFPAISQKAEEGQFEMRTARPLYQGDEAEHVADWVPGDPSCAWKYSRGRDGGRKFYGLAAAQRGAMLLYHGKKSGSPEDSISRLTAVLIPDKDTGEGFGSANGQYTELHLKFDEDTRTGYALRIERRGCFANGCVFSLREYQNGVSRVISSAQMSSAYMPPCFADLEIRNGKMTAVVSTGWPHRPVQDIKKQIPDRVFLEAPVRENGLNDAAVFTTGTVPIGNRTLIGSLRIR